MTPIRDRMPTASASPEAPGRVGRALAAAALATALAAAGGPAAAQQAVPQDRSGIAEAAPAAGFSELAKSRLPAVVTVTSTREIPEEERMAIPQFPPGSPFERFFDEFGITPELRPESRPARALGSGFVIDPEGYIVTNNHVVQDADEILVVLNDNRELPADLVGTDPATDLALLKVESDEALPALSWGDSDAAEVGDWVVAIGNPFGLGGTVTAGIISAKTRDIHAGPYDAFIQTDAAINQGNSGGPLLNLAGEVIGVNTAIFSQSGGNIGIGFAVPASMAQPVIADLREDGEVERGWLGVSIQPVTDEIAEALGLDETEGALVSSVVEGSPAAEAGVETGDVIVRFGGQEIDSPRTLQRVVADTEVGSAADVTVVRNGEERALSVQIARLEPEDMQVATAEPEPTNEEAIGLTLAPLTPEMRAQFGIAEDESGAIVAGVDPGSPAEEAGLQPGDVITRVGGSRVEAPQDVVAAVNQARQEGRNSILVLTERGGRPQFVPLPLG